MVDTHRYAAPRYRRHGGFTLIELLVVIAIIAMLIAVLLPSLSAARKQGQAVKCGTNLHSVSQAMGAYLVDSSVYPASYVYPSYSNDNWSPETQSPDHPFGYLHWSYYLYSRGKVDAKAFQCPSYQNGGAPRTNPGMSDWEDGQVDQNGASGPNGLEDRQAPRMAYTGNAAIFPRNKFTVELSGGERVNQFVPESIVAPGAILATEFNSNWKAIGVDQGGVVLSKSHRPISPFIHVGSGTDEYGAPLDTPGFT
jgi:prepilin-type N-terminal cleavage/methylation domain-containing protein